MLPGKMATLRAEVQLVFVLCAVLQAENKILVVGNGLGCSINLKAMVVCLLLTYFVLRFGMDLLMYKLFSIFIDVFLYEINPCLYPLALQLA